MAISINTNNAATRASMYLASNHANLQKSLDRLSSGRRITQPADDAGGLAVSMKLEHDSKVLRGTSHNISNAISLLQVQDGVMKTAADIVTRMGELKSMHSDVTKNAADKANYQSEFVDLQLQLNNLGSTEFNGIALFEDDVAYETAAGVKNASGNNLSLTASGGNQINVSRSLLLAGLTVAVVYAGTPPALTTPLRSSDTYTGATNTADPSTAGTYTISLAVDAAANAADLSDVEPAVLTKALENVAALWAENGGEVRRLQYELANVETQITNLTAANGRIMDVDVALESSNLARQQVLVQASAAMTAQANVANDVALMLLR